MSQTKLKVTDEFYTNPNFSFEKNIVRDLNVFFEILPDYTTLKPITK